MMVEVEALQSIRSEIVTSLTNTERPESLQSELLDELCAVDRQLGAVALFTVDRGHYEAPLVHPPSDTPAQTVQYETLF